MDAVKALIVIDGDVVCPEKSYLACKAQGGSLLAFQLAEQARRWISREVGKDSIISCLIFADIAHLSRAIELPSEGIAAFSKGLSSTPIPAAFIHCLQGNTLAAMNAHLQFQLRSLDYIFLGGFSTDLHAHHLNKLYQLSTTSKAGTLPSLVVIDVPGSTTNEEVIRIARGRTRFQGLQAVNEFRREDVSTLVHRAIPNGYTAPTRIELPITSPASFPLPPPSGPPPRSYSVPVEVPLATLPSTAEESNPWLVDEPTIAPVRRAEPTPAQTTPDYPPGLILPTTAPATHAVNGARVPSRATRPPPPPEERPVFVNASPPRTPPSSMAIDTTRPPSPPSPPRLALPAPPPLAPAARPSPPSDASSVTTSPSISTTSNAEVVKIPRTSAIPNRYLPLLRLIQELHSHSSTTTTTTPSTSSSSEAIVSPVPPPPLWSAIGSSFGSRLRPTMNSLGYPKSTKLKDWILEAQQQGWVVTGKGTGEGTEWVKVSARGQRALMKLATTTSNSSGGIGGDGSGSSSSTRDMSSPTKSLTGSMLVKNGGGGGNKKR